MSQAGNQLVSKIVRGKMSANEQTVFFASRYHWAKKNRDVLSEQQYECVLSSGAEARKLPAQARIGGEQTAWHCTHNLQNSKNVIFENTFLYYNWSFKDKIKSASSYLGKP